jgi:hypothetical protein
VAGIALDAVETARVHRHDRSLHINEIVFAQSASSLGWKAATSVP